MQRITNVQILVAYAMALVVTGCSPQREAPPETHPKIVALRKLLVAEQERLLAAGAIRVHHFVSIAPTTEGLYGSLESEDRRSLSFSYSTRSIDRADIATVIEMVERPPPQPPEIEDRSVVWQDAQWVTYDVWFRRHHPQEAAQLDAFFDRLRRWLGPKIGPDTQPSNMPAP